MSNELNNKRIILKKGDQRDFLERVCKKLQKPKKEVAAFCNIHVRTFSDWLREKGSLPEKTALLLSQTTGIPLPKHEVRDQYWFCKKYAAKGGKALFKKHGRVVTTERYRKEKWNEWWETEGKDSIETVPVKIPAESEQLAEWTGIILGDGGVNPYQVYITLSSEEWAYAKYISKLSYRLFSTRPDIAKRKKEKALNIIISRKGLVLFCKEKLGIKIGSKKKQNVAIPQWILKNPTYLTACIRGLIDTDGSIFLEKHTYKNKKYQYPRLNFVSVTPKLVHGVYLGLTQLGLEPRIRKNGRAVQVENISKIWEYLRVVGTRNARHKKRFKKFLGRSV